VRQAPVAFFPGSHETSARHGNINLDARLHLAASALTAGSRNAQ
jgi:hypothetical protein